MLYELLFHPRSTQLPQEPNSSWTPHGHSLTAPKRDGRENWRQNRTGRLKQKLFTKPRVKQKQKCNSTTRRTHRADQRTAPPSNNPVPSHSPQLHTPLCSATWLRTTPASFQHLRWPHLAPAPAIMAAAVPQGGPAPGRLPSFSNDQRFSLLLTVSQLKLVHTHIP